MKRETLLLLIVVILAFIVFRQCNSSVGDGGGVDLTPDTLYVPGKIDTVFFKRDSIVYRYLKPDKAEEVVDAVTGDTSMLYETNIDDSLITAKIVSNVKGTLLSTNFNYTPKFPKFITRVDTFKINTPIPVPKEKWGLYIGAEIGGNATMFMLQPTLLVKTNKDLQVSAGYDLIHKTYHVGAYTQLKWPKFIRSRN